MCKRALIVDTQIDSDHMPIHTKISCATSCAGIEEPKITKLQKLSWNTAKCEQFLQNLSSKQFTDSLARAMNSVEECIDTSLEIFTSALIDAATCMKKTHFIGKKVHDKSPWFDDECQVLKRNTRKALRLFRRTKNLTDNIAYQTLRKQYKHLIRTKKAAYKEMRLGLLLNSLGCPRDFWNEMRKHRPKSFVSNSITEREWVSHFESVFNGDSITENDNDDEELIFSSSDTNFDEFFYGEIKEEEIKKSTSKHKNRQSSRS